MTSAAKLLDKVRDSCSIPSDNALATRLNLSRSLISGWRSGNVPMPDDRIAQLCAMAHEDAPTWAARIHEEQAKSAAERSMWAQMVRRLSAAAVVTLAVFAGAPGAGAAPLPTGHDNGGSIHYVHYKMRAGSD
mgnify:CR=1 FL=1